ncbi:hypothetical protein B5F10_12400 [Anaerotruncus colihominis]|uniref:Macro domain-containing protein n=1 Tax=Anaerotruncus colihominis TaxID=169435 RepID=A0A1Y4MZA2_9FIRM|nr:macro domain-containing protein [Anaerotruncus colihominis]OUP66602.1 hypothetical protein B5F11_19105 [Anaerotruncus colihominis]OUP73021.1 hypothetical protein B5F10_12400 [Anaerotruncus colihominis]
MRLVLGDITKMDTDAIVNAASSDLRPCPGICSAIFAAADTEKLLAACKKIGRCRIGKAVITPSFGLACKYIIHVAGVGWYSGRYNDRMLFADCYRSALQKAAAYHCKSVAIPLMFSGDFHIPRAQALQIVADVVSGFEKSHPSLEISLVLYKQSIYDLAKKIISNAQK